MNKTITTLGAIALFTLPFAASAQSVCGEYTVQQGDTLGEISLQRLGTSRDFLKIFEANKDVMPSGPDQIAVGMVLKIPCAEGAQTASATAIESGAYCTGFGPQTPRDISSVLGLNATTAAMATSYDQMNLCNIHSHTNAEHKGPGFSVFVNDTDNGGYACNETDQLTAAELAPVDGTAPRYGGVKPGDTIEVHWVHSSCSVAPGPTLASCLSEQCANPSLRVETQVFLVVNDSNALDFNDFDYSGKNTAGYHQAAALPTNSGTPVEFLGSTTGPSYTQQTCSPFQVTWSVRPSCLKVDIGSLDRWSVVNPFEEKKSHGVRQLVTAPELLSQIEPTASN